MRIWQPQPVSFWWPQTPICTTGHGLEEEDEDLWRLRVCSFCFFISKSHTSLPESSIKLNWKYVDPILSQSFTRHVNASETGPQPRPLKLVPFLRQPQFDVFGEVGVLAVTILMFCFEHIYRRSYVQPIMFDFCFSLAPNWALWPVPS